MKCPDHPFTSMKLTDWKPVPGLDPRLREFRCPRCDTRIYKIPRGFESAQEVKDVGIQER